MWLGFSPVTAIGLWLTPGSRPRCLRAWSLCFCSHVPLSLTLQFPHLSLLNSSMGLFSSPGIAVANRSGPCPLSSLASCHFPHLLQTPALRAELQTVPGASVVFLSCHGSPCWSSQDPFPETFSDLPCAFLCEHVACWTPPVSLPQS